MALKLSNLEYSNDLGNPIVASVGKRSIEDCITIVNDALNGLVDNSPYSYKISVGKIKVVDGGLFKKTQIPRFRFSHTECSPRFGQRTFASSRVLTSRPTAARAHAPKRQSKL